MVLVSSCGLGRKMNLKKSSKNGCQIVAELSKTGKCIILTLSGYGTPVGVCLQTSKYGPVSNVAARSLGACST